MVINDSLIESERRYRALFENMNAGFVLFEVIQDSNNLPFDLKIIIANQGFEATTGLQREAVVGKRLTHVLPGIENDPADWIGKYGNIAITGDSLQFEDSSELLGRFYSVIAYQAAPKQCAVTFLDITDRKRMEIENKKISEELRNHKIKLESIIEERTKELKDKNLELDAFSYSVSHDLRAPLRHMSGYLNIIEEDFSDDIDELGLEYLKRSMQSLAKMNYMIDSMLQLSRISDREIIKKPLNLSQLMSEISENIIIEGQNIALKIDDTPDSLGDAGLLRIALSNLLENAIKYTKKKSTPLIEFGSIRENDKTVFFIRDNGSGFNMQYADKLFVPFQRLHSQSEFEGIGIGLSTVQRVIRKHKGEIRAEGKVGKGAVFFFDLGKNN